MFDNINDLFISPNANGSASVWRNGDNPNGPDEIVESHTLDPMVWDVLRNVLPYRHFPND